MSAISAVVNPSALTKVELSLHFSVDKNTVEIHSDVVDR
jgi:hypothetical protein